MIEVETYTAEIYCGLKEGYEGKIYNQGLVRPVVQNYCDTVKLGCTITFTHFVYVEGDEPGVVVGIINYPRFPKTRAEIQFHAFELAELLKDRFNQHRVSVVFPDKTVMLGEM